MILPGIQYETPPSTPPRSPPHSPRSARKSSTVGSLKVVTLCAASAALAACTTSLLCVLILRDSGTFGTSIHVKDQSNVAPSQSDVNVVSQRLLRSEKVDAVDSSSQENPRSSASSVCPQCEGVWRPDYDYEANHKEWNKQYGKVEAIRLLGERHSGTNWITDHLDECFGEEVAVAVEYSKFKHWFQEDDPTKVSHKSSIVISLFRDPFDWIMAMNERPHHAHHHLNLPWLQFVTKPWVSDTYTRGDTDRNITQNGEESKVTCLDGYSYKEIVPCSPEDSLHEHIEGYGDYKYELMHDKSERAYSSIVDLRSAKIKNHLAVSKFQGTRAFYPFRYEDLNTQGTEMLLSLVEQATGFERSENCTAYEAKDTFKHKEVTQEYIEWMNNFVDWDAEALIGYHKRSSLKDTFDASEKVVFV